MPRLYGTGICGSSMKMPEAYLPDACFLAHHWFMTNIAHYRKMRGLTQTDLAEMVGVKQPHISRIEKGDDGVSLRLYKDIASALRVELYELFTDEMNDAEALLLEAFRQVPPQIQRSWIEMARVAAAQPQTEDR